MKAILIGGHPTPAFAVIDAAPKDMEMVFVGRKYMMEGDKTPSFEYQTITAKDIPFIPISAGRIQRRLTKHTLPSLFKVPVGYSQSLKILHSEKPDIVVGFGGYVSVPVCLAAFTLGIPFIIHEQTLSTGLANKVLAPFATNICLSWPQSLEYFPKQKAVITGNPVRKFNTPHIRIEFTDKHLPMLYVTGGSTGSHAINVLIEEVLLQLLERYNVVHQTGDALEFGDYDRLYAKRKSLLPTLQRRYQLMKFVPAHDVGTYLHSADLIVSRSGMNTVTEILHFGKPSLLIPLPHGQRKEQLYNAQFIKKSGLGEYLVQDTTTGQMLLNAIEEMIKNRAKYIAHAVDAQKLVHKDAAKRIIEVIYEVYHKGQQKKTQTPK